MQRWLYLCLLAGSSLGLAAAQPLPKTQARLVVAADTARPGDTVMAGVHLKMAPRWHTYWKHSGDSGAPTKIVWQLPAGITAGEIQWPPPEKNLLADLTTYVYHDEVVLLVPLKLASDLAPGHLELRAKVSWLECEEQCFPGKADVQVKLALGNETKPSDDSKLIETWQKRLPSKSSDLAARAWWESPPSGDERPVILELEAKDNPEDFFPYASPQFEVQAATEKLKAAAGKVRFRKRVKKFEGDWPDQLQGIVIRKTAGEMASASELNVLISSAATAVDQKRAVVPLSLTLLAGQLALAFLGGLILNIMPCVLPVIALKIFGFVSQAKEHPQVVRKLGLIYAAGVLVSFLVLAGVVLGVQQAGRTAGWGMQMQNLKFLIAMTVLITLVALNLFGLFEVTLSGGAMGAASQWAAQGGAPGAFFNGVLATLLATPCTAPFLGTAVAFAFAQPPAIIILVFLTVGLGLAAPYVVLAWKPGWLKFLPKPGAWMEKFKIAMGFPMLATAFWLFTLTLNHFSKKDALWFGLFLVTLAMSAWIWGEFVQRGVKRRGLAGAVSILLTSAVVVYAGSRAEKIKWQPWSQEAVAKARAEGRPVLVDFTADWCVTCQANKRTSLEIKKVQQKLKDIDAVTLIGDWSVEDARITEELAKHGRSAVPLVLVYPKNASLPPLELPPLLTPQLVLDALEKAAQ